MVIVGLVCQRHDNICFKFFLGNEETPSIEQSLSEYFLGQWGDIWRNRFRNYVAYEYIHFMLCMLSWSISVTSDLWVLMAMGWRWEQQKALRKDGLWAICKSFINFLLIHFFNKIHCEVIYIISFTVIQIITYNHSRPFNHVLHLIYSAMHPH